MELNELANLKSTILPQVNKPLQGQVASVRELGASSPCLAKVRSKVGDLKG